MNPKRLVLPEQRLAVADIRVDGGTQLRIETDAAVVADYAEALLRGVVFPRVRVVYDGSTYWLVDGFHRLAAHKHAGIEEVLADVEEGDLALARLRACGANLDHGLRRSNETKRNVVREALSNPHAQGWSNQKVAELCGVSAPFVAQMRQALGLVPDQVVGKNGKVYKLADKLTEGHVYACPSLAVVEQWARDYAQHKTLGEVLRRYATHLRDIEQAKHAEQIRYVVRSYSLQNAARKGDGIRQAVVLRIERLLGEQAGAPLLVAPEAWDAALDAAPAPDPAWNLALVPGISSDQRKRALLAVDQFDDYGVSYSREEAATAVLRARWDAKQQPRATPPRPPPLTPERVQAMNPSELRELSTGWEVHQNSALRAAAVAAAALVAPDLIASCVDPVCGSQWIGDRRYCPNCHGDRDQTVRRMAAEAACTDARRRLSQSPLHLVLEILAREPEWKPEDETLFWNRVAAWRAAGCQGLSPVEVASEEVDEDQELDEDEDEDAA